jgi:uncharacterized membrane protein
MTERNSRTLGGMSEVLDPLDETPPPRDARPLAMLNYGLIFSSIFFAGVPALIAVALAYGQRPRATPLLRSHFRFQIGLFWTGFFIALLAGSLVLTGVVMAVAELVGASGRTLSDGFQFRDLRVQGDIMALMIGGVLLAATDAVMLMAGSAFGFIRLASNRSLGKSAA